MAHEYNENSYDSASESLPVLLVDDEAAALELCRDALRSHGINNVILCQDSRQVRDIVRGRAIGVVLLDLRMPHLSGEDLLLQLSEEFPEVHVIIVTGINEVHAAVKCMKLGAFDYLVKPVEESRVATAALRAIQLRELKRENSLLKAHVLTRELEHPQAFSAIVTDNDDMLAIMQYAEAVAPSSQPVLIMGETGTGKELFARAIHRVSGRRGPFVPINVAGLDDALFADTLFGHVKGAFTGADRPLRGLVEQAAGGSLFLDEIGDLSTNVQVKLLRLLQEREYSPLGSNITKRTDARVIVATNRDLESAVSEGRFRKDLYYRLRTHCIVIPPLRDRIDDIPLLLDYFLAQAAQALGKKKPTPPPELASLLASYAFPGNVRELAAMAHDAVSNHKTRMLSMDLFKMHLQFEEPSPQPSGGWPEGDERMFSRWDRLPTLKTAMQELITEALRRAEGNQTLAAKLLGVTRAALNKRLTRARNPETSSDAK